MSNEPTWVRWRGQWHTVLARSNYEQPGYTACGEVWTDKPELTRRWSEPDDDRCDLCVAKTTMIRDTIEKLEELLLYMGAIPADAVPTEGKPLFRYFPWPH